MVNSHSLNKTAIVIGAGIAGCGAAYALANSGWDVKIFDSAEKTASKGSGNRLAILYPRVEAIWNNVTEFYHRALLYLLSILKHKNVAAACDFNQSGLLMLPRRSSDIARFKKIDAHGKREYARLVSSLEASDISGVQLNEPCLYMPLCGTLSIPKLCHLFLSNSKISLKLGAAIESINFDGKSWHIRSAGNIIASSDIVVIANSYASQELLIHKIPGIEKIKGQVNYLPKSGIELKSILCRRGYITPAHDGIHHIGATFEKVYESCDTSVEATRENIAYARDLLPSIKEVAEDLEGRAAIRCYSRDRMPVIGEYKPESGYRGLYLSICHGSRGALSGPLGGAIISQIANSESIAENSKFISPARFQGLLR